MKFLVDAQLPRRLARWLQAEGHQALHTRDLPDGNRTADATLNEISIRDLCVLVTKDEDFVVTFLLRRDCKPANVSGNPAIVIAPPQLPIVTLQFGLQACH